VRRALPIEVGLFCSGMSPVRNSTNMFHSLGWRLKSRLASALRRWPSTCVDGATPGPRRRATGGHAPQPQISIWRPRAFTGLNGLRKARFSHKQDASLSLRVTMAGQWTSAPNGETTQCGVAASITAQTPQAFFHDLDDVPIRPAGTRGEMSLKIGCHSSGEIRSSVSCLMVHRAKLRTSALCNLLLKGPRRLCGDILPLTSFVKRLSLQRF